MSVQERKAWITGEEVGRERRRLIQAGAAHDSPEMQALWKRVDERDDYLWERFARPLIAEHRGQWAAVSLQGEILLASTPVEVHRVAIEKFGSGNFVYGKLAEFRGYDLA